MGYSTYISPKAVSDIRQTSNWYNEQKRQLGNRFINQVKTQIDSISDYPKSFAVKYKNIRCAPVPKFPFLIHYRLNTKTRVIDIVAIFHTSQNPKMWNKRV